LERYDRLVAVIASHGHRFSDWPTEINSFEVERDGSFLAGESFAGPILYRSAAARGMNVFDDQQLVPGVREIKIRLNNLAKGDLAEVEDRLGELNVSTGSGREESLREGGKRSHEGCDRKGDS
jgi:hypothetical protein